MKIRPGLGGTGQGILLMIATMFLFSVMDAMAKEVAHRTDTVIAIWARYTGQTVVVALLAIPRMKHVLKTRYPGLQLLRSIFLLVATTFFFFGFVIIGLANAAAIMSLNPVLITVGAALIGLMLGSLRILWPWPAAAEGGIDEVTIGAPDSDTLLPALVGFAVAVAVVVGIASMVRSEEPATAA